MIAKHKSALEKVTDETFFQNIISLYLKVVTILTTGATLQQPKVERNWMKMSFYFQ